MLCVYLLKTLKTILNFTETYTGLIAHR